MRVDGPGATEQANKLKKKGNVRSSGTDFDAYLSAADETGETSATTNVTSLPNIGALLSLQELPGNKEGNAKALKHGEDILAELSDLRMGLLSGLIPPEKLQNLSQLVKLSKDETIDPALQDILRDIEVRALVELEKFKKAQEKAR